MLTSRVGDDGAVNGLAIERDTLHTLLSAIRMDGDLVLRVAELTLYGVVVGRLRQTRINADTVVVGFDTADSSRKAPPYAASDTSLPRMKAGSSHSVPRHRYHDQRVSHR